MELKYRSQQRRQQHRHGSNCTFMELKWVKAAKEQKAKEVLIVPLWNWNIHWDNWTNKLIIVLIVPLWNWNWWAHQTWQKQEFSSNCTFMELKLRNRRHGRNGFFRSNCTFMELKLLDYIVEHLENQRF